MSAEKLTTKIQVVCFPVRGIVVNAKNSVKHKEELPDSEHGQKKNEHQGEFCICCSERLHKDDSAP